MQININDFLPLIIMLVIFLSIIRKALSSRKKPSPKKTGKLKQVLGEMAEQIRKELERGRIKTQPESTGWEQFLPKTKGQDNVLEIEEAAKAQPAERRKTVAKENVAVQEKETAVAQAERYCPRYADFALKNLRKAVVWSEILAPPLALRDDHRNK